MERWSRAIEPHESFSGRVGFKTLPFFCLILLNVRERVVMRRGASRVCARNTIHYPAPKIPNGGRVGRVDARNQHARARSLNTEISVLG